MQGPTATESRNPHHVDSRCEVFPNLGVPFEGPHMKDYGILGFILGSSYLGKLPCGPVKKRGLMELGNPNDCHSSGPDMSKNTSIP